jgi:ABC-type sugar transport system substrate-binding protein
MAMGVVEVMKAAGKLDDVIITGINGSQDALESIRDGELTMTVEYDPFETAVVAIEVLVNYVENGVVPPDYVSAAGDNISIITQENVDKFIGKIDRMLNELHPNYQK